MEEQKGLRELPKFLELVRVSLWILIHTQFTLLTVTLAVS